MIAETKVVVKYSSCGGRRLPVQMGPQRNQETMRYCREPWCCHNVNVMSQCCPSESLFNEFWNVIVPWWVSWTTMIPDTKKCGGGRLRWFSLRPRTTPPWHGHSDCIMIYVYRHQSRMVSLSHRFRVLEGLPLFLLVTMAQFPKVPLDTELRSFPQGRSPRAAGPPPSQCHDDVGTGSKLFYVNMWALQWPLDRPL